MNKENFHMDQVKECYMCGEEGFDLCSECSDFAVHKYCLGILPGSIFDTEYVYWTCKDCRQLMKSASSGRKNEIILIEEQPRPLCTLLPIEYIRQKEFQSNDDIYKESPKELMSGVVLVVSPSGEINIIDDSFATSILINMSSNSGVNNEDDGDKLVRRLRSRDLGRASSTVKGNDHKSQLPETKTVKRSKRQREEIDVCPRLLRSQRRKIELRHRVVHVVT